MVPLIHYRADQIKYNIKMNQIDQSQVYAFMQNQLGISLNKKKKKLGIS